MTTPIQTGPLIALRDNVDIADTPAPWSTGFGAAISESFQGSPGPLLWRWLGRQNDEQGPIIPVEEANERYAIGNLTFDEKSYPSGVDELEARELNNLQRAQLRRQELQRRAGLGLTSRFVAGLGGAILDPLNIAGGL